MLIITIKNIFSQLASVIDLTTVDLYTMPCPKMKNASVGQHVRHIIELFQGLENGYEKGIINYENRKRDKQIETDKQLAIELLNSMAANLDRPDKDLIMETCPGENDDDCILIKTNYQRELAYNLDHAIHHMAMIRIAINELSDLDIPENFGKAFSTIKFNNTCAQ
jgi:hypothetical protein